VNRLIMFVLLALMGGCAAARNGSAPVAADLAFIHVTVVDVEGGRVLGDQTVLIAGNRIAAVAPAASVTVSGWTEVVDARGMYLIPGLWDMHAHQLWSNDTVERLFFNFDPSAGSFAAWETYYGSALDLLAAAGVTGFRDPWGDLEVARRVLREADAGQRLAPRFVVAGNMIDGDPPLWPGTLVPEGPAHGRILVDSLARAGADFIKVQSRLPGDVFAAIADQAHETNVPVVGHVPWRVRALEAAGAGMRSMEHLDGVLQGCTVHEDSILGLNRAWAVTKARGDHAAAKRLDHQVLGLTLSSRDDVRCRALLQRLADLEVWQVPTLVASRSTALLRDPALLSDERLRWIHPEMRTSWRPENDPRFAQATQEDWRLWRAMHERKLEITGMMADMGVPLLAGTDYPNPYIIPGFGLHDELVLLVEAGLSPLQALQAATLNPARYLGRTDKFGTVKAGMLADLVVLDANPLEDIRNTQRIRAVVLNGRYLDRFALDRLLAEAERGTNR
jgi:imidazolonepropionase-like amidohydrolase